METKGAVNALAALAQESRLAIFRLLVEAGPAGLPAGQISERMGVPPSSLSFHLKELTHAKLVTPRQQGRFIIYSANFAEMNALVGYLTENCCGGESCADDGSSASCEIGAGRSYNVLFLCAANSARSIMAEAVLNHLGQGRFRAYSAGSAPSGEVHPFARTVLQSAGLQVAGLHSKSWNEFLQPDAPVMDFVFSLCDKVAGEPCLAWPGSPITGHWGFDDPARVDGTPEQQRRAFERVHQEISQRVRLFLSLPFDKIDRLALRQRVAQIETVSLED